MPLLLQVLLVGGVLFGIAVVATGRGDAMAEMPPDAATPSLPGEDVALTGNDVRAVRFGLAFRGYRMSEVDAVLARLADELDARDRELEGWDEDDDEDGDDLDAVLRGERGGYAPGTFDDDES